MCAYFGGPEDAPFLIVGEQVVGWRREWMRQMVLTNCADFLAFYQSTIEPELTDQQKTIMQAVSADEIVAAFDNFRLSLTRDAEKDEE